MSTGTAIGTVITIDADNNISYMNTILNNDFTNMVETYCKDSKNNSDLLDLVCGIEINYKHKRYS